MVITAGVCVYVAAGAWCLLLARYVFKTRIQQLMLGWIAGLLFLAAYFLSRGFR